MVRQWSDTLNRIVSARVREAPMADPPYAAVLKRFSETDNCPEGWPDDWKPAGAALVRRESTIYRLSSGRWPRSICVKIVKGARDGLKDSASFYEALCHYHARTDRENGYTVPEPYGWIPEDHAVIMEWVEGQTFSEILKRQLFFTKRRHENLRKVAGWLRWFHAQSEIERGNLRNGWQLKAIRKAFDQNPDLDLAAMAHDTAIREHIEVAASHSGLVRGLGIESAILHGDFKTTNVIISDSGVVGIDFMGRRRGTVSQDIFRFLSDVDFYRGLLGRSSALIWGGRANDFEVFLAAYGGRVAKIARPSWTYLYFLTSLSVLVHQRRKFKRGAEHMIRLAVVRGIVKRLSHEISRESLPVAAKPVRPGWLPWPILPKIPRIRFPVEWGVAIWESDLIWSFL